MVEDLLYHEITLREQTEAGPQLVFPSQLTRERPDLPDPQGKVVSFIFEGSALNVYATLAVRLSYSGLFQKKDMWENATIYTHAGSGVGIYGVFLREPEEGKGELTLFFDKQASEEMRFLFEHFVQLHLQRRAVASSLQRRRIFICPDCDTPVLDIAVVRRREKGHDSIECNVCGQTISLLDYQERLQKAINPSHMSSMDRVIDARREFETADSVLQSCKPSAPAATVILTH
jgi:hypothetical protein